MSTPLLVPRGRLAPALAIGALVAGSVAVAPAAYAAAPDITGLAVSAVSSAEIGEEVAVDVTGDATDLFAYEITVDFDPALLDYVGATWPDGGVGVVDETSGEVTVSYTRLGTSPGLEGEGLTLASLQFETLAAGEAAVTVSGATAVSSTTETVALDAGASARIAIAAEVPPTVEPDPEDDVVASPTPSVAPAGSGSDDDGAASAGDEAAASDDLLATGGDSGAWILAAGLGVAILALGATLLVRRRAVQR
ncbi:cohesin domain-containing protein [Microbacterium sp. ZXX196]|uniref:cohesin domain-containing protein n=1 Tax=Microbacterium sp. ZXX196 TaxID=2609291 RepID=UPI0012B6C9A6|nr:LPXTG cell wall anchor domain-containing protein [Microbacterium sp. ZXX196]